MAAAPDAPRRPPSVLAVLLVAVVAMAGLARELNNLRVADGGPGGGWFSVDPDGLYHARRLERALDEGRVAPTDPLLNHPEGAAIPWPPYYTVVLRALLGPIAPPGPARAIWIERAVATAPAWFAALTAAVVALSAWRFGGALAAGLTGATFAWLGASLDYSVPGIGDHHAFATLLAAVVFLLTAHCFSEPERSARGALALGATAGGAAGLLLGSWVGGLVQVVLVQAALGWLLIVNGRRRVAGLAPFGLAFHAALALAVAPAVLASPWREQHPWMMINLSWFHLAQPLLGALVFVPLLLVAPASAGARRLPWFVAGALALLALALGTTDLAVARAVREGFAWAGRNNEFMAYITESQPLAWGQIGGVSALHAKLGPIAWLALPAWAWVAWRAWRGRPGLVVWAVALPPMLAQALVQRRFAEACGVPLAVVLGVAAAGLAHGIRAQTATAGRPGRSVGGGGGGGIPGGRPAAPGARALGAGLLGLLLGTLGQWPSVARTIGRTRAGQHQASGPAIADQQSFRKLYDWLREHGAPGSGVLAAWELGHAIEWVARRPTVATNFGSYVGAEGYLAPWRFYLEEDPAAAEAILIERDVRDVLILGRFSNNLEVMLDLLRPDERQAFRKVPPAGPPEPTARWFRTLAARLMLTGKVGDPRAGALTGDSLDFLRLVHVSPEPLRTPMAIPHTGGVVPAGWVWERVPGARVTARGAPGEVLEVRFDVEYPAAGRKLLWSARAEADASGTARVRVPYASDEPNGDGLAGPVRWSFGSRAGALDVPAAAVLSGGEVEVP